MNDRQFTSVARQLESVLGEAEVTRIGRESSFAQRLREVTPHRLLLSIVGAMASTCVETIADLQRAFRALTGRSVEYKPFHNQLAKEAFPVFMYGVFEALLGKLVVRTLAAVPGDALAEFEDIVIQDGSSFAVHDALESVFPGRFTTVSPAAIELHATMSVLNGQPLRVSIAPDSQGERDFLPEPDELRGKLLMADRGYMDIGYCGRVNAAGGRFLIRFTRQANPRVVGGSLEGGHPLPRRWLGRKVKDLASRLRARSADLDVMFDVGGQEVAMRLVLSWNPERKDHMRLATNLCRERFDLDTVRGLYRLRWQVELLFKEWKSYANLRPYCTRKAPVAEGLIWAALCTSLLKRFLAHAAQAVHRGAEVSTRIAAMALVHHLPRLVDRLLRRRSIRTVLRDLLEFLATTCRRAHPVRDRVLGRLSSGLRPTFTNARLAVCVLKN
jgi:hypothetical protein